MRSLLAAVPVVLAVLTAGCASGHTSSSHTASQASQRPTSPPVVTLPSCSAGTGRDGTTGLLRIRQRGREFTGTYTNSGLKYRVAGTLTGHRFSSLWTAAGVNLSITGNYTARQIVLDDPHHQYGVDRLAAIPCP